MQGTLIGWVCYRTGPDEKLVLTDMKARDCIPCRWEDPGFHRTR